jgi:hypothetical protein
MLLAFIVLYLPQDTVEATPPQTSEMQLIFKRALGGIGREGGRGIQQVDDGGYVVAGVTSSVGEGEWNIWLVKLGSDGSLDWTRAYSNQGGGYQGGESVQETRDGGLILAGCANAGSSKDYDVQLIKVDHDGRELWNRTYGGSGWDWGYCARQTVDDGYIITGWTDSQGYGGGDLWLIKTDAQGNELWNRTYGGVENDLGNSVLPTDDGGYVITGATGSYSVGNDDLWVIRTDAYGEVHWMRTFGGTGYDEGSCVERTADGGYVIVGSTTSTGAGNHDIWLLKLDAKGHLEWNKTYGGAEWDWGSAVQEAPDGGLIVVGTTLSQGAGEADVWLIKTNSYGEEEWSRTYGGPDLDFGHSVCSTEDGGYILTGQTYSFGAGDADMWVIKTDSQGLTTF